MLKTKVPLVPGRIVHLLCAILCSNPQAIGILFLTLSFSVLHSQPIIDQQFVRFTAQNDGWGGGFTEINDDNRSFGFLLEGQFRIGNQIANGRAQFSGFTRRKAPSSGPPNELDPQSVSDSSRLDELEIVLGYPIFRFKNRFQLEGRVGGYLTGNLGGEGIQNGIHEAAGVPTLHFPYSSSNSFAPLIGVKFSGEQPIGNIFPDINYGVRFNIQYDYAFEYLQSTQLSAGVYGRGTFADEFALSFGYNAQDVESDVTRITAASVEKGFFVEYSMQMGLAYFKAQIFPESSFSYGGMGINIQLGEERRSLEETDLLFEMGTTGNGQGFYQRFLCAGPFEASSPFKLDFHYQFWSLTRGRISNYPKQQGHFQQLSLGVQYSPFTVTNEFQILPYVDARLGVRGERIYTGTVESQSYNVRSATAIGEIGARIKLPGNIISKNCFYGLNIYYMYAQPLFSFNDVPDISSFAFAQPYGAIGFGGFVMVDL